MIQYDLTCRFNKILPEAEKTRFYFFKSESHRLDFKNIKYTGKMDVYTQIILQVLFHKVHVYYRLRKSLNWPSASEGNETKLLWRFIETFDWL